MRFSKTHRLVSSLRAPSLCTAALWTDDQRWCACGSSNIQHRLVQYSWPWFVQIYLHVVSAQHHLAIFTAESSELWGVFPPCTMTSYIYVLAIIYQTKQLQAKEHGDLGMFVDVRGTLYNLWVFNGFGLLAETNSRVGKTGETLILKLLHHVFHVPQQKTDLYNTVRPDQFTVLTFDKSYQNRNPPLRSLSPQWKHSPRP